MTAPYTQGLAVHIEKGRREAHNAQGTFVGLAGRGATAPGAVVIRSNPTNTLHPFMVHFLNTQDGGYYFGDYCTDITEARRALESKLSRYDPHCELSRAFKTLEPIT